MTMSFPSGGRLDGRRLERASQNPVAHLARLWRAFEQSGDISAYIAYRMHLAHLVHRGEAITYPKGNHQP